MYSPPFGQFLFNRWRKAKDIFRDNQDYYQSAEYLDKYEFGSEKFRIKDVYQNFYKNVCINCNNEKLLYRHNDIQYKHSQIFIFSIHFKITQGPITTDKD